MIKGNSVIGAIQRRLPGGNIYKDLAQSIKGPHYGFKASLLRFLRCLSVYCLGCRGRGFARKNYPIGELREPYPKLYHFTPHTNVEKILKEGLIPGPSGAVYMTEWKGLFAGRELSCFEIDVVRLVASHHMNVMISLHEFTTDYVPPECLKLIEPPGRK